MQGVVYDKLSPLTTNVGRLADVLEGMTLPAIYNVMAMKARPRQLGKGVHDKNRSLKVYQ